MVKFTIASRVVLIAVSLYGIFQICELIKPHLDNQVQYYFCFIALFVFAFWSIIDWGVKEITGSKGRSSK
ncbi:MAG: hypothetical protein II828_08780 [Clostridia bacterium]|nr:hypothetical protein [Clostridia bacterium]